MMALSTIIFAIALLCLLAITFLVYILIIAPSLSPLNALPGPPPTSLIAGNAKQLSVFSWDEQNPFPSVHLQWLKQYGPAYHCRILGIERLTIADPDALKHVTVTNAKNYPRHILSRAFIASFTSGYGLLGTEDPVHASQRKLFNPHFSSAKLKAFVDIFKQNAQVLTQKLKTLADAATVVNVNQMMTNLSFDIIGLAAFGHNFNAQNDFSSDVMAAYDALDSVPHFFITFGIAYIPGFEKLPLPVLKKREEAKKVLYKVVDDVIARKFAAPPTAARDLLDLMLDSDGQAKITPEEAKTHVLTFLLAGHETTSNALSFICYAIATYPGVEEKIAQELKRVTEISWESLAELKYLTAVIHETMRLHPTVMNLAPRYCLKDDYLPMADGKPVFVPKGTQVYSNLAANNRNPQYWVRPDEFLPERFLDGSELNLADAKLRNGRALTYIYMPFSIGPKQCIGNRFALAEIQVVMAMILAKYSFKLHSSADIQPCVLGLTVKPKNLTMTVHLRS